MAGAASNEAPNRYPKPRCAPLRAKPSVDLPAFAEHLCEVHSIRWYLLHSYVFEASPVNARYDQIRALRFRASLRAHGGFAGLPRKRLSLAKLLVDRTLDHRRDGGSKLRRHELEQ